MPAPGSSVILTSADDLDRPVIFLDNDGTLTDGEAMHALYCRRYGELMSRRYGGAVEDWADANSAAFRVMMHWYQDNEAQYADATFFEGLYRIEAEAAFAHMGLEPPPWETEGRLVHRRLLFECPAGACALFAGAREAVLELAGQGHRLNLASNAHSLHCEGVLSGAGLRQHFVHAFGPDLVNCAAKSAEFYRRACAHVGVKPEQAILVDDNGSPLAMAQEVGMRTVFVDQWRSRELPDRAPHATVGSVAEVPRAIAALAGRE